MSGPPVGLLHPRHWDVLVVGAGHAGTEAALAAARMGCDVALLTASVDRVGWMSCNPSIGGVGKSHLVAEIDALGGEMARNADRAGVHYKLLNHSRGPAVHALRAQCDKLEYATAMRQRIEAEPRIVLLQGTAAGLWLEGGRVRGVRTGHGVYYQADAVVLTAGTFLSAVCHTGDRQEAGGRAGEGAANALGDQLRALDLRTLRHKTGTCPRVSGRTIAWSRTSEDPGLSPPPRMARNGPAPALPQMSCFATRTTAATHALIRDALPRSPLFSGRIEGQGPRYCPSIEDKVVRFAERQEHGLFLEREGWRTDEVYVAGLSTSLPVDVQFAMVRTLPGLEQAEIVRFGYAVEYDTIDPRQLGPDLGLSRCPGLYFAGQVNGTSGYEEAGAQGLWAGVQAAAFAKGRTAPTLSRADAYLGVMIDDLITRGGDEPYRMLTSRAEHRLSLRCGNADLRLAELATELGLIDSAAQAAVAARRQRLADATTRLEQVRVSTRPEVVEHLLQRGHGGLTSPASLADLLRRPTMDWETLAPWLPEDLKPGADGLLQDDADRDELVVALRYAAYEARERNRVTRTRRAEAVALPVDLDFSAVHGLSFEAAEKLSQARPATLGAASRIPGVTPAAISALHVHLETRIRREGAASSQ